MNVAQLKEILSGMDDEVEVMFSHPSHDYWHTQLATPVGMVKVGIIQHSDYHNQDVMVDEDSEPDDSHKLVIVLS